MEPVYGLLAPVVTPYCRRLVAQCGHMKTARRQKGFTLLELMTALSVAGILLAVAVPSMVDFVRVNRLRASAREVVVDLSLARNEAVLRAAPVTVCTSTDLATCSNSGWNDGRIVFTDADADGAVDVGDLILGVTRPLNAALTTTSNGIAAANFITFSAQGRLANWGQITLCTADEVRRDVTVRRSGAATLDRTVIPC
jgi:type IV fimbrial biogenesis protein FimT